MNNGLIVVNKPMGLTSRDVVNKVCKVFNTKQVGHIGTLDPMATGVLVCLMGKYTKLSNILVNHDKEYIAEFKLGIQTDTLDITGNILKEEDYSLDIKKINEALSYFKKTYMQEVPIYSAVKVNGRKLYDYARNGLNIELPKKEVTIYSLDLLEINEDIVKIKCRVSKGTYIRALIRDIGLYLGTNATMTSLIRTSLDKFKIEESCTINDLESNNFKIYDIKDIFSVLEINITDEEEYKHIKNGNLVDMSVSNYVLFTFNNKRIALYMPYNNKIRPLIMF